MKPYRIEKGIKIPAVTRSPSTGKPSLAAATLALLAKGDSFLVRDALDATRADKVMRDMNARQRRTNGKVFAARKVKGGIRFWRVR